LPAVRMRQPTQHVIEGTVFHRDQNDVFYPGILGRGEQRILTLPNGAYVPQSLLHAFGTDRPVRRQHRDFHSSDDMGSAGRCRN